MLGLSNKIIAVSTIYFAPLLLADPARSALLIRKCTHRNDSIAEGKMFKCPEC